MSYVGDRIPYKYVVGKGKKDDWEELVEFPSAEGRHVNRCLVIPNDIPENGKYLRACFF